VVEAVGEHIGIVAEVISTFLAVVVVVVLVYLEKVAMDPLVIGLYTALQDVILELEEEEVLEVQLEAMDRLTVLEVILWLLAATAAIMVVAEALQ
jgi:hypothetical protein